MSYVYGIVTLALGASAAACAAWGLVGNGALWIALGMVLGVFTALCVMEWPDTPMGDSSPRRAWVAVFRLALGIMATLLLRSVPGIGWASGVSFAGGATCFAMLLAANLKER